MALREFKLPDPGEGLTEAEIVTWHVKPGDTVKVNDVVVEVETAKSLVELPVPFAGTVSALHVAEGDTVEVGTPIITIDDGRGGRMPRAGSRGRRRLPDAPPTPPAEDIEEGLIGGTTSTGAPRCSSATASSRPRPSVAPAWAAPPPVPGAPTARASQAPGRGTASTPVSGSERSPSHRCASWPRTSASTWRR